MMIQSNPIARYSEIKQNIMQVTSSETSSTDKQKDPQKDQPKDKQDTMYKKNPNGSISILA